MKRATSDIERLLRHAPGATKSIRRSVRRGAIIADLIDARFGCGLSPQAWRAKHLRWVLERGLSCAATTKYDYWRTIRLLGSAMGRWNNWEPHLRGPWCATVRSSGKGGRPPKLPRP